MVLCVKCGRQLREGEGHSCANPSGSENQRGRISFGKDISAMASQIDKNVILGLLRNPLVGLRLDPVKDIRYGVIGLVASTIGFLIWVLLISNKIGNIFDGIFGGFSILMGESSLDSKLIGMLFLVGVISMVALLASLWSIGNWQGNRKIKWTEIVTTIGSTQLSFGAGFIIAGILGLFSLYLSFLAIGIVLLTNLIITVLAGNEIYQVEADKRFSFIASSISTYLILFYILFKIII